MEVEIKPKHFNLDTNFNQRYPYMSKSDFALQCFQVFFFFLLFFCFFKSFKLVIPRYDIIIHGLSAVWSTCSTFAFILEATIATIYMKQLAQMQSNNSIV